MSATPRPTWYEGEYGCPEDMYAASVALPIFREHDALVAKVAAYEAFVAEVRDLRATYVRDNNESLNTFGQHHPVAWSAAEHLNPPFATLDVALGGDK